MIIKNLISEEDCRRTAKLYCEIWKEPPWNEDFWKPEEVIRDLQEQMVKKNAIFLIATNGTTEIMGFTWGYEVSIAELSQISGIPVPTWEQETRRKRFFYIDEFGVKQTYRGRGIGQKLVQELLEQTSCSDINCVTLRTDVLAIPARKVSGSSHPKISSKSPVEKPRRETTLQAILIGEPV